MALFDAFPDLKNELISIRRMDESDVDSLTEIPTMITYIAISIISFIAGIYLSSKPEKLVGLAEMFDYKKKENSITIGYRINEAY